MECKNRCLDWKKHRQPAPTSSPISSLEIILYHTTLPFFYSPAISAVVFLPCIKDSFGYIKSFNVYYKYVLIISTITPSFPEGRKRLNIKL